MSGPIRGQYSHLVPLRRAYQLHHCLPELVTEHWAALAGVTLQLRLDSRLNILTVFYRQINIRKGAGCLKLRQAIKKSKS